MPIRFLDPTQPAEVIPATLAERGPLVQPVTVGLLSNGKTNAARFLELLAERLAKILAISRTVERNKDDSSKNASGEMLDDLAEVCDFALVAIGD